MPDRDPDVRIAIEHSIKVLSRWTIGLYLAVALVLGWGVLANRAVVNAQRDANVQTQKALCTFVGDLQQRVNNTVEFLDKHPGPFPIPNVARETFRTTLSNQRRTLHSLDGLRCEEVST